MGTKIVLYQSPRSDHTRWIFYPKFFAISFTQICEFGSPRGWLFTFLSPCGLFEFPPLVKESLSTQGYLYLPIFQCIVGNMLLLLALFIKPLVCCQPATSLLLALDLYTPPKYTSLQSQLVPRTVQQYWSSCVHPDSHHVMHLCYHPWFHTKTPFLLCLV